MIWKVIATELLLTLGKKALEKIAEELSDDKEDE